jgi:tetratricopeptide (TPR) repeat protein
MPRRAALEDALDAAQSLLSLDRADDALRTYTHALGMVRSRADAVAVHVAMRAQTLPTPEPWRALEARVAWRAGDMGAMKNALGTMRNPPAALTAWLCLEQGQSEQAQRCAERAVGDRLDATDAAAAWRAGVRASYALGADWRSGATKARAHLTGRDLGLLLLDLAVMTTLNGDQPEARSLYAQSLPLLAEDTLMLATARHNLGLACLRAGDVRDAERHLEAAAHLTKREDARPFAARAWCGVAAVRRQALEYQRAEAAYRTATTMHGDLEDHRQAWRGLGNIYRFTGRMGDALEVFEHALSHAPNPKCSEVWVDIACARASIGAFDSAQAALEYAALNDEGVVDRAEIVRAALEHARGDSLAAKARLGALRRDQLWFQEEARCLPKLFALLEDNGVPAVPRRLAVQLCADGPLRVSIAGREVYYPSTARSGELLVLLALGVGSIEVLGEHLFPSERADDKTRRAQAQAVSGLVRDARRRLGWSGSVRALRGAYRLDPDADWALVQPTPAHREQFLEGVQQNWVQDQRQQLE